MFHNQNLALAVDQFFHAADDVGVRIWSTVGRCSINCSGEKHGKSCVFVFHAPSGRRMIIKIEIIINMDVIVSQPAGTGPDVPLASHNMAGFYKCFGQGNHHSSVGFRIDVSKKSASGIET